MGSVGWLEGTEDPCAQQPWLLTQGGVITSAIDPSVSVYNPLWYTEGEPSPFPQSPVGAEVSISLGCCKTAGQIALRSLTPVHLGSPDVSG